MAAPQVCIAYNTDRFEETLRFYKEVLGLETLESWDRTDSRGALISAGGTTVIEVFAAARTAPPLTPPPRDSFTIMFEAADLDARHRDLVAKGAEIEMPPTARPWARRFTLRDPNGVEIMIYKWTEAGNRGTQY